MLTCTGVFAACIGVDMLDLVVAPAGVCPFCSFGIFKAAGVPAVPNDPAAPEVQNSAHRFNHQKSHHASHIEEC